MVRRCCVQLAVFGACQCGTAGCEPCTCSRLAASMMHDIAQLSDQVCHSLTLLYSVHVAIYSFCLLCQLLIVRPLLFVGSDVLSNVVGCFVNVTAVLVHR